MRASKGFTLVELAVVIAIVAILAAVAVPKLIDSTDSAERAVALDFVSQLNSAAAMYTAKQMAAPQAFTNFVTNATTIAATAPHSISTANMAGNKCTVAATTITCAKGTSFKKIGALYNWNNGSITYTITP